MKLFYPAVSGFLKIYFRLFYQLKVYGLENLPDGAAILAPNHASFFDPPVIAASCKEEVSFLARASLFRHFLFGSLISKLNAHPVTGTAQDLASIKLICNLLKENKKVVVFPEGIRTEDGELGEIKPGIGMLSLRANAPIVPVFIKGTYEVWSKDKKWPKPWGHISCTFGKAIYPQEFSMLGKKEAQEALAEAVKNSLSIIAS
ncbi:MAG TPA: lysophospholipid acyltransferase family protein [Parachlamydiaceae bacterium]|nr:lysophospholipid acyltransferase family protein [Parachlamydiaceae bacterium]